MTKILNAAVIGLGFGTQFLSIYQRHPNTSMYAICRRSKDSLVAIGDAFGVEKRCTRFRTFCPIRPSISCTSILR